MPDFLTYEFVKEFQTAIVGVIGFAGVILTLVINAAAVRRQEKRELHRRHLTVRGTMLAELLSVQVQLESNVNLLTRNGLEPEDPVMIAKLRHEKENLISTEIGLLHQLEVKNLMAVVEVISSLSEVIDVTANRNVNTDALSVDARHFLCRPDDRELLLSAHRQCLEAIKLFMDSMSESIF